MMLTSRSGYQIWAQNRSDWPKMGQIRDFFRSDFSLIEPNVLKTDLKSPGFVPFGANLTHFGAKPTIPGQTTLVRAGCDCTTDVYFNRSS